MKTLTLNKNITGLIINNLSNSKALITWIENHF
jgi:hypothetical protein